MDQNVYCSENELKKASNQIINYITFVNRKYSEFTGILSEFDKAFSDVAVNTEIAMLVEDITPHIYMLNDRSDDIKKAINTYVTEIEAADTFDYPATKMDGLRAILSQFI